MNLHTIVAPIVGAVNVNQPVTLYQNAGSVTNADFSRTPAYSTFTMNAQIQGLQSDDIRLLNGLGIQGERRKVYLWGTWSGLVRSLQKGNDLLVFPDGSVWKVQYVFEDFGHGASGASGWCSIAVVLQNPTSEGGPIPPGPPPPPAPPSIQFFDNYGAIGPVSFTLPPWSPLASLYVYTVDAPQLLTINTSGLDTIGLQEQNVSSLSSNQIYASVTLGISSLPGVWIVRNMVQGWAGT